MKEMVIIDKADLTALLDSLNESTYSFGITLDSNPRYSWDVCNLCGEKNYAIFPHDENNIQHKPDCLIYTIRKLKELL